MSIILLGSNTTPLVVSLSSTEAAGGRHGAGICFTGTIDATALGGVAPYTYAWSYVSGDTGIAAIPSNGPSTVFRATLATNETKFGVWKLIVTDTLGTVSAPVFVNIYLEEINFN